ncbi:hypothetical protein P389DRAFT_207116 [Cystobasidium minutum MCA 4210]|uniref:uncharacterized protein n=1 Tax=Cystobasidium minutum MCA 4210 TaxID=1397322 RepID=UPI0034CE3532|eukprot:jgi/Rhomi1/207116/MIX7945_244_39
MDQQSLQALLLELRGLDEVAPPAQSTAGSEDSEDSKHGTIAETSTKQNDNVASTSTSDYTAWYEDYVKTTNPAAVSAPVTAAPPVASPPPSASQAPQQDIRKLTYAQALPIISRLASDEVFLEALQELKSNQETFELSLLDERNRAKAELERQLKKAREAAAISGTQYERISKLLNATMTKFDKAALTRWDNLMRDQQARLEQLGVPCFYVLKNPDPVAQERQRRVMETLTTLLSEV